MNNFAFVCSEGINSDSCQSFGDSLLYIFLLLISAVIGLIALVSFIISFFNRRKNKDKSVNFKGKHSSFSIFFYSAFLGIVLVGFGSFLIIVFDLYKVINALIILMLIIFYTFAVKSYIKE